MQWPMGKSIMTVTERGNENVNKTGKAGMRYVYVYSSVSGFVIHFIGPFVQ